MSMMSWHRTFINIAKEFAKHSTCCRKQVGAIIVKDKRVISAGYNGVSSGKIHCNEIFKNNDYASNDFIRIHSEWSKINESHAESNCITYAAKIGVSVNDCILYTTLSPCIDCAKQILNSGIKEVYFDEVYDRDQSGITYLQESGIKIERIINE